MLGHVVDAFLGKNNVCARLDDFVNHVAEHVLFLFYERLHLLRAFDIDFGVEFGFLNLERCVQKQNFCLLHTFRHSGMRNVFVQHYALDELCVPHGFAGFLLNLHIVYVCLVLLAFLLSNRKN